MRNDRYIGTRHDVAIPHRAGALQLAVDGFCFLDLDFLGFLGLSCFLLQLLLRSLRVGWGLGGVELSDGVCLLFVD